ncbi:chemotaxis protein CheW [Alkalibacterium olivapovliticus]|uniref:Chemotaxis signal transduction protein n=1 Tax=Alkalibacterium olivapovliticus TaxID=99907 RepID=A0A2T0VTU6_9LACT|nr:chemotaxis protein CheW [Alkalibacterium olivapovliticus]PRY74656.1 chemotaxis signal transduction protein [Alkalibacterium olivapovliticus]
MAQHLLFKAGGQTFGFPITITDKIIALENHTAVPDVSSYIVGVQEIEGEVLAIIDLAERFYGMSAPQPEEADIILVNWKETKIGLLVDEVTVVQSYHTEDLIDSDEEKIDGLSTSYITAFVQTSDGIVPILDSDCLFAEEKGEELRRLVSIQKVQN